MKRLTSLLMAVLMLVSAQTVFGLEFTERITENVPVLRGLTKTECPALGTSNQTLNTSYLVAESSKYIFTVVGQKANGFTVNNAIEVWDKSTGELVTAIAQGSSNATYYCPVLDMYVEDDVLYVAWGNAAYNHDKTAFYALGTSDGSFSPLKAYDVSDIDSETGVGSGLYVYGGNARTDKNLPYVLGTISYMDKENGKIYASKVSSKAGNTRSYVVMDAVAVKNGVKAGSNENIEKKYFYTTGLSMNAVQFMVKDGYLFEVLQNKAGLINYTGEDTLTTNNAVYVYDLNDVELTSQTQDVSGRLKGIYTTAVEGTAAIRDIEVIGDALYVSTSAGVEVVDLTPAYAEGITEAVTLTSSNMLTSIGGARDLDALGTTLYAAFEGPQSFSTPNSKSEAGSIVIYNASEELSPKEVATQSVAYGALDMAIDKKNEIIYVMNDTMGPPSMAAYAYTASKPSFEAGFAFGSEVEENIPALTTVTNTNSALSTTTWSANTSQMLLENDKYVFVALTKENFTTCGVVQIFDKKDGSLLATLSEATSNAIRYRPIRNMHLSGDILYVTWGNAWNSGDANAFVLGSTMSPVKAYDVSNVTAENPPVGIQFFTGGQRTATHAPYILGNLSYLDEEEGMLYTSQVMNKSYGARYYYGYKLSDLEKVVDAGSASGLTAACFHTSGMDAAQFMVKDGWLYEVHQNKGGFSAWDCDDTLTTNNVVKVYDLSGKTFTSTDISVSNCLRGTYTTAVEGDKAIRDIEVIGDTLYVSTSAGVEVVDLTSAKAEDVTSETAVVLTASKTLTGVGGARDLESDGNKLFAAFEGPESFKAPNSTSAEGEAVAYDTSETPLNPSVIGRQTVKFGALDMALNKNEGIMYVLNDTQGPPSMKAYNFSSPMISFVCESGTSYELNAGIYDICINVSNSDSVSGSVICALYDGSRLSDVVIATGTAEGKVVLEDVEISEDISKLKIMYLSDANSSVMPLCKLAEIEK